MRLSGERAEHGGAAFNPEVRVLLAGGQVHRDHVRALAGRVVVARADVAVWKNDLWVHVCVGVCQCVCVFALHAFYLESFAIKRILSHIFK